jgi:hypothetical protein
VKRAVFAFLIVLGTALGGCMDGPPLPARVRYNDGVKALAENKFEDAAKAFLDARSEAGYDGALRYRAAFNLGETYARQGEKAAADGAEHDAAAAIEHYRQAAAWFSDALRLQKDDADARANLERVQARILALVDEANKGANGLEKRLDELISGERKLRDVVRGLWQAQDQRGAGADPLADKDAFDATSTQQRTLGAEAGVVADLAGDEITAIGGKGEAERKDEEKARLVQLQNLDLYVQDARKEMTDARRNLTELKAELAYRRVEGALEALKRAREQLLDPITVLRGVAQDHVELLGHVAAIEQSRGGLKLGEARPEIPQWMQPVALGGRQLDIRARLEEVKARLAAAKDQEKVKDAIAAATPAIEAASAAMMRATEALRADDVKTAAVAQREALEALARAIEQFLDLRGLIDISLAEQGPVVAALTPPAEGQTAMTPAERARIVGDGAARNRDRVVRMAAMIAEAATPPAPPADAQPGQPPAPAEDPEAAKQREALYARAETLRVEALVALDQLVAVAKGGKGPAALESATTAQKKLEEMQQLFFSVIEHLKKLIRDQGETRDNTNDAVGQDDLSRRPLLPPIAQRQGGHAQAADAIANALAQQADAAAQAEAQGQGQQPQGGPGPQAFKEAAGEVRNALTSMQTAIETLTKASDPSANMSFDLTPVTESQQQAIEHLENALRLLQPPQKQDDQKQDQQQQDQQKQDQQKQDQQKQDQQKQDQQQQQQQSKDDAEKRLQQVREREAQRQRERREQQRAAPDPVDKDW